MKKFITNLLISLSLAIITFFLSFYSLFPSVNYLLTDKLYSRLRTPDRNIIIIAIDENTLGEYGAFTSWSRDKIADAINFLYSKNGDEPAVVGIDILFQGETSPDVDEKLYQSCLGDNKRIVSSNILSFKGKIEKFDDRSLYYNSSNIDTLACNFDKFEKITNAGFTNAQESSDSIVRNNRNFITYNGKNLKSFSYAIAETYANYKNIELPTIETNDNSQYRFFYAGKQMDFQRVSLKDLLDKKIPTSEFKDKIVLIGPYAAGMQDEKYVTYDISGTMYGVEIHANMVQSILEGCTAINVDQTKYSIIISLLSFVFCFAACYFNLVISIIEIIIGLVAHLFIGKYLANNGLIISQLYAAISFALMFFLVVIRRLLVELNRRKHITQVFNRYMDPNLVANLVKDDQNKFNLNGEKKEVAVLFVDIRGFTTMSESMDPADVVGVLNEYLGYVTECIFKHHGMLDKFIGDAAMAVFNAPIDQDDYIYEAVATAYDIAKGSEEISQKLFDKYGKTVSYGVGVHWGEAVIGNIGSKTRMDYTAIGDTVNTSSRIEGQAKKGEILISSIVKEKLEGRIKVSEEMYLNLKGKAEPFKVYRLIDIKSEDA